jgi:hypothetical protein
MIWRVSHRACPRAAAIADRHYNRQKIGASQFVPPGRCLVLLAEPAPGQRALWVTSWPFPEWVKHRWAGAWTCSLFRNEGAGLASELIRDAVSATRFQFGDPPALGMITFVDERKVKRTRRPGYTFRRAGFEDDGRTIDQDLLALRLTPGRMPAAEPALGMTFGLAV